MQVHLSSKRGEEKTLTMTYKGYIALFICYSTSIHLELVTDYTAEGFIAAFKRFIARQGICSTQVTVEQTLRAQMQNYKDYSPRLLKNRIDSQLYWLMMEPNGGSTHHLSHILTVNRRRELNP